MLSEGATVRAQNVLAAPLVFASKKNASLRFSVDYRKVNAVTKRDVSKTQRMDKFINLFGETAIFFTLCANSGYWNVEIKIKS